MGLGLLYSGVGVLPSTQTIITEVFEMSMLFAIFLSVKSV